MFLFNKFMKRKRTKPYRYNQNSRKRFSLEEKFKRVKEMWELRTIKHLTLRAIGEQKGLTRERVRQILLFYNQYIDK